MTPYLLGGSGALLGIIAALWFWRKATKAQGDLRLQKVKTETVQEKLDHAKATNKAERKRRGEAVLRHAGELKQKEAELVVHRKNEQALRDAVAKGGTKGLIALANKQYGVVVPPGRPHSG